MTKVLITGGSRGLGRALGAAFAREGARVVLVARDERAVDEAAHALGVQALAADVGDPDAAARIAGAAAELLGGVPDVVIHNASTLGPVPLRPLAETTDAELERALQVNLLGPFRLTRAVVGAMVLRGSGTVVHVSSDAAIEGYANWGAYGASKAALDHLARIWAAELEGTGVRFVSIDPGEMNTAMHAQALPEADPSTLARPEEVAARIVRSLARGDFRSGQRVVAKEWA